MDAVPEANDRRCLRRRHHDSAAFEPVTPTVSALLG